MEKDAYPLILVLIRSRGSLELISVIEGKSTPSEVLLNLIQSHDLFEQQKQRDAEEEIMREKREDLKKQQEDEYHRSLQADLAKEQARLDDERRQKEEQNANEKLKQQRLVKRFFFLN
jgi:FAS-associated factor 2